METTKKSVGRPAKKELELQSPEPSDEIVTNTVPKAQFEALQDSYRLKCQEYDRLYNTYRSTIIRFHDAGEQAKQFISTAFTGINLVFPEDIKKEN